MKIQLKTVKKEIYEVEVDPSITIGELKQTIETQLGNNFPKAWQTLIVSGQVMVDDRTVQSYNVKEKDFIVLFLKKPKESVSTKPAETPVETAPEKPQNQEPSQSEKKEGTDTSSTPTSPPSSDTSSTESNLAWGDTMVSQEQLLAMIDKISEMGFPKEQVAYALRASFGNPDRAVEYLMTGTIPQVDVMPRAAVPSGSLNRPSESGPNAARPPSATGAPLGSGTGAPSGSGTGAPSGSGTGSVPSGSGTGGAPSVGGGVFDQLRSHPQFHQLCKLAQEGGEEALKSILTYFAQTNPELIAYIAQHQAEFIQLLNTPVPPTLGGGGGGGGGGPASAIPPPGAVRRFQITPAEEQVINTFVAMGFDRRRVCEAYFLFEKDEQLTAEYLLNNPNDEEDTQQ